MKQSRNRVLFTSAALAVAGTMLMAAPAAAQMTSAMTADEIERVLDDAGLSPEMSEDAATGAPVARAQFGDIIFWVRALDCKSGVCGTLMLFANFELGRSVTGDDYRVINRFNDGQVYGRAYALEAQSEIGVDYVIELDGGVSMSNVTNNISRWADVIDSFLTNFREGVDGA